MRKYVDVDILDTLAAVVKLNTRHYQSDFEYDRKTITNTASSASPEPLLWMSRQSGTWCFNERDTFIFGSDENNTWLNYLGAEERIIAFAVEASGMKNGKPMGTLYELDYNRHAEHVKKSALPIDAVTLTFEGGEVKRLPYEKYIGNLGAIQYKNGNITDLRYEVADNCWLGTVLEQEHEARHKFHARSIAGYIQKLSADSRPSALQKLEAAKKEVTPPVPGECPPKSKSGHDL